VNLLLLKNSDNTIDIVAKQGATWEFFVNCGINLTGYTARGQIRASYAAIDAVEFAVSIIPPATDGKLRILLGADSSASLAAYKDNIDPSRRATYKGAGVYVYDIEIESQDGYVTRLLEGRIYVDPEVTR